MGINEIDDLKPKDIELEAEQFPDGTHEGVPIKGPDGDILGTAVVTFNEGKWLAYLTMGAAAITSLGVNVGLAETTFKDGKMLHLTVEPVATEASSKGD